MLPWSRYQYKRGFRGSVEHIRDVSVDLRTVKAFVVDCRGLVYAVSVPRLLRYLQSCGNEALRVILKFQARVKLLQRYRTDHHNFDQFLDCWIESGMVDPLLIFGISIDFTRTRL